MAVPKAAPSTESTAVTIVALVHRELGDCTHRRWIAVGLGQACPDQRPMRQPAIARRGVSAVLMPVLTILVILISLISASLGQRQGAPRLVRLGRRSSKLRRPVFKSVVAGRAVRRRFRRHEDASRKIDDIRVALTPFLRHLGFLVFVFGIAGRTTCLTN
jgi:hypothetical protein